MTPDTLARLQLARQRNADDWNQVWPDTGAMNNGWGYRAAHDDRNFLLGLLERYDRAEAVARAAHRLGYGGVRSEWEALRDALAKWREGKK